MINTISKTLGAQEKTQDIKQSPSTKIGTKSDARSRRNELIEVTGRWTAHRGDRTLDQTLSSKVNGAGCQSPINISKVPKSCFRDRTRPVSADRTLVRVRSVAEKRDFVPNGYFLSGAYK